MSKKPVVLVFLGYYLPGFKSGGPLRSLVNLIDGLSNDFDFRIVTRGRDLGDSLSYDGVALDSWQTVGAVSVYYCSGDGMAVGRIGEILRENPCDVLYLNSFFDINFTIKVLLARRLLRNYSVPCILAPRGEFSEGALSIKRFKKRLFIFFAKIFGLYNNVTWQASSDFERKDIAKRFLVSANGIFVAPDISACSGKWYERLEVRGRARFVFISRISPMKNLHYALELLGKIRSSVDFDIYGPIEDEGYWHECLAAINALPDNVFVSYKGGLNPVDVKSTFSNYDLFLFPTKGENFGHVILESLSSGTPVLISTETPWRGLVKNGFGWDISLTSPDEFVAVMEHVASMSMAEKNEWRRKLIESYDANFRETDSIALNKELFFSVIKANYP